MMVFSLFSNKFFCRLFPIAGLCSLESRVVEGNQSPLSNCTLPIMERVMQKHKPIQFILNGEPREISVAPELSLLEVLREQFDLVAAKNGCSPQGSCGCCTVLVDDKAVVSCVVPAAKIAGKCVQTLEGLPELQRERLAQSFVHAGGLQCGFCIPGIAMRAHSLLQNNSTPTRDDIARALNNHICRCTGYTKIIDAIDLAAKVFRGAPLPAADTSGKVGT